MSELEQRIAEYCADPANEYLLVFEQVQAELSRMRTALEEIGAMHGQTLAMSDGDPVERAWFKIGATDAFNACAAIAERALAPRALTAGSGNE